MAFDTFDEGINLGGVRSKSEIKILICYIYNSVKEEIDRDTVIQAILKQGLANYFEIGSAFDDLVKNGNLEKIRSDGEMFALTPNGEEIAGMLDDRVALTVREKAYACAVQLLSEKKKRRESKVEIEKIENGFKVCCTVLGGDAELMSVSFYAPDMPQALVVKNNFLHGCAKVYKTMLALLTGDKESAGEALEEVYDIAQREVRS